MHDVIEQRRDEAQTELTKAWSLDTTSTLPALHARLAAHRIVSCPKVYVGTEGAENALHFVRNNYPTRFDAALACDVFGC
jgi:hypothetical protein